MYKKLFMAFMALTALAAFALPATASATNDPQLTDANGTLIPAKAKIVGTNVGETTFTNTAGEPLVHCTKAVMTGEVHRNSGGIVEGTITTTDFSGTGPVHADNNLNECTGSFGNAYITVTPDLCIRSTPGMATDEFQVTKGNCTTEEKNVEFVIGSTTIGACEYQATGPIKGDYTTGAHDTLTVRHTQEGSGAKKVGGGFFCPASGMLKMTFTLETDINNETVIIS